MEVGRIAPGILKRVLTSKMHMSRVRNISGRLKSDFFYSAGIVYNNFHGRKIHPKNKTNPQKPPRKMF